MIAFRVSRPLLLGVLVLLAACSAPAAPTDTAPSSPSPPAASSAFTPTAAASAPATDTAPAPVVRARQELHQVPGFDPFSSVAMLEVLGERDGGLLVRHGYGETVAPQKPQRIFAADQPTLEILLALGVRPVGGVAEAAFPPALEAAAEGIVLLEVPNDTLNLESVAQLQPDLILGYGFLGYNEDPDLWAQFNTIAPTLSFLGDPYSLLWQQGLRDVAQLLGIAERAEQVLAAYETDLATIRAQIQQRIGAETVAVIEARPEAIQLYSPGYYLNGLHLPYFTASWAFVDLQLMPAPEVQALATQKDFFGRTEVSLERLPSLEADHLFVFSRSITGGAEALSQLLEQPLWQTVPAVQAGNAYVLPQISLGAGPYSSRAFLQRVVDAVQRSATGGGSTTMVDGKQRQ